MSLIKPTSKTELENHFNFSINDKAPVAIEALKAVEITHNSIVRIVGQLVSKEETKLLKESDYIISRVRQYVMELQSACNKQENQQVMNDFSNWLINQHFVIK